MNKVIIGSSIAAVTVVSVAAVATYRFFRNRKTTPTVLDDLYPEDSGYPHPPSHTNVMPNYGDWCATQAAHRLKRMQRFTQHVTPSAEALQKSIRTAGKTKKPRTASSFADLGDLIRDAEVQPAQA